MTIPRLEARGITKFFEHGRHRLQALGGISLSADPGDFVCLVGPSGCGKSTFLRIVAGLENTDSGHILADGRPLTGTGPSRLMVFQEGALFPWLTVRDNVEFGLRMAGMPREKRADMSERYLDMMRLVQFAGAYTHQLSTGMRQRVAIARALVMDPDVLLMDEPFAALDTHTRDELLMETHLMWLRTKKTVLFVTHSISEAVALGTKIVIFGGRPSVVRTVLDNDACVLDLASPAAIGAEINKQQQRQEEKIRQIMRGA